LGDAPQETFAALGSWELSRASAGECGFVIQAASGRSYVTVYRRGFDSDALAINEVETNRSSFSGDSRFELRDEPAVQGFGTLSESPGGEGPVTSVYARKGALVAEAIAAGKAAVREDWYRIVRVLAEAALADVAVVQNLASCPLLESARARELLGQTTSVEQPGDSRCVFRSALGVLQVSRKKGGHELIEYITPDGCDSELLPALGEEARVTRDCSDTGEMQVAFAIERDLVSVRLSLKQPLDDQSRKRVLAIARTLRGQ
jgi:hypothetical protein